MNKPDKIDRDRLLSSRPPEGADKGLRRPIPANRGMSLRERFYMAPKPAAVVGGGLTTLQGYIKTGEFSVNTILEFSALLATAGIAGYVEDRRAKRPSEGRNRVMRAARLATVAGVCAASFGGIISAKHAFFPAHEESGRERVPEAEYGVGPMKAQSDDWLISMGFGAAVAGAGAYLHNGRRRNSEGNTLEQELKADGEISAPTIIGADANDEPSELIGSDAENSKSASDEEDVSPEGDDSDLIDGDAQVGTETPFWVERIEGGVSGEFSSLAPPDKGDPSWVDSLESDEVVVGGVVADRDMSVPNWVSPVKNEKPSVPDENDPED